MPARERRWRADLEIGSGDWNGRGAQRPEGQRHVGAQRSGRPILCPDAGSRVQSETEAIPDPHSCDRPRDSGSGTMRAPHRLPDIWRRIHSTGPASRAREGTSCRAVPVQPWRPPQSTAVRWPRGTSSRGSCERPGARPHRRRGLRPHGRGVAGFAQGRRRHRCQRQRRRDPSGDPRTRRALTRVALDASAGVEIALQTPDGLRIESLLPQPTTFWVPEHYFSEVAGVLRRSEINGRYPAARVQAALDKLLISPTNSVAVKPRLSEARQRTEPPGRENHAVGTQIGIRTTVVPLATGNRSRKPLRPSGLRGFKSHSLRHRNCWPDRVFARSPLASRIRFGRLRSGRMCGPGRCFPCGSGSWVTLWDAGPVRGRQWLR